MVGRAVLEACAVEGLRPSVGRSVERLWLHERGVRNTACRRQRSNLKKQWHNWQGTSHITLGDFLFKCKFYANNSGPLSFQASL